MDNRNINNEENCITESTTDLSDSSNGINFGENDDTVYVRRYMVSKLVHHIKGSIQYSMSQQRDILKEACGIEADIYRKSKSKSEYYDLIVEAIYNIRKEKAEILKENLLPEDLNDWRKSLTMDLRNHIVLKFVNAILPNPDSIMIRDKRFSHLISYAKKSEQDAYQKAASRSEYYHLIADKIYCIQKELAKKRQKRCEVKVVETEERNE